jgi:hypothetical protein
MNGLFAEWSRMMGEKTPNCTHRVASSSSRTPRVCPPMSWLHHEYPIFDAVAVNSGWNARDAHETTVSPENPTAYRWLPGPAYRENVMPGPPSRAASTWWKWFSTHSGSTPGRPEVRPCCQSIHQKSTP